MTTLSPGNPPPSKTPSIFKVLAPIAAILAVVLVALYALKSSVSSKNEGEAGHDQAAVEIQTGTVLPDVTLHAFGGGTKKIGDLKAKVVLMNFWASWCEACMVEMQSIVKLREAYHDKGFEVAAIDVDDNPEAVIPKIVRQKGMTFPVFTDDGQRLSELFDVHAIPLSVVMNKDRKVLMLESGERDWNGKDIRSQLEEWLSE